MDKRIAVVTMVKDDLFFLRNWIRYYGALFGRKNLYIVNHGHGAAVAAEAEGCNLLGVPEGEVRNFDKVRWRLLNGIVGGLLPYFAHVIVGDVDELVVLDPAIGKDLREWLAEQPGGRVLTPVCLELIHDRVTETEAIDSRILGHRKFARTHLKYSKPCVLSTETKLSRGGHFASAEALNCPDPLYVFHLKYCDFSNYSDTMMARNRVTAGTDVAKSHIGRHWFEEFRGQDTATFDSFTKLPADESFDFTALRQRMHATFAPRGNSGFYQFDIRDVPNRYRIPDRFFGLF